jgi:sec-independent protein translocase protein TatA
MSLSLLPLALLPDFGGGEMMLVLFVVLLLFGPDKLPHLAKGIGKSLREFKKAASDVEREIKRAIDEVPDVATIVPRDPPPSTVAKTPASPIPASAVPTQIAPAATTDSTAPASPASPPSTPPATEP